MALAIDAIPDRLAEDTVCLLLARHVEQNPSAPGENDAMDVHFILDGELKMVERFTRGLVDQSSKDLFRSRLIRCTRGLAQAFAIEAMWSKCRSLNGVQQFLSASAFLLDPVGIAIEHLQHGQTSLRLGKLLRHV